MQIKVFKLKYGIRFMYCTLFTWVGCEYKGGNNVAEAQNIPSIHTIVDSSTHNHYTWHSANVSAENYLLNRIPPPKGFERIEVQFGSFGDWLRHLPLKSGKPKVLLYSGEQKHNQSVHFAVVDIDTGKEDLQQCADAVMRLKSEYHYSVGEYDKIHFKFTSGDEANYVKWKEGYRPKISGNKVSWGKTAEPSATYKTFRSYLRQVFMYAGSSSLSKEMIAVDLSDLTIGDVFIRGGFPGHAVIVLDVVINSETGAKQFLLAQSYMPAQDIHILLNPKTQNSPWYTMPEGNSLVTPEWTFERTDLKRFK